jgi:hypothetical protein
MRKWMIALAAVALLAVIDAGIAARETQLASGTPVLLELVPVDPRSLIQGDFMRLSYRVVRDAFPDRVAIPQYGDGRMVVTLDARGVGHFIRFDDGAPLGAHEVRLRYRVRAGVFLRGRTWRRFHRRPLRRVPHRGRRRDDSGTAARRGPGRIAPAIALARC